MSSTFWVREDRLDEEQRRAVEGIPEDLSFILKGPAGSGKTNVLLLRAKWLTLRARTNFKIVVFTGSLRSFVARGCEHYGIDPNAVTTQMMFLRNLLSEYGVAYELSKHDFEADRAQLAGKALSLIQAGHVSRDYCESILLDEAQDYTDTELIVFRGLCRTLVLAADSRQSIYKVSHTPELVEGLVDNLVVELNFHYRCGLALCKVADAVLPDRRVYRELQGECKYPERDRPSSVTKVDCPSFEHQIQEVLVRVREQLELYPGELIGVLFPRNEERELFEASFNAADINDADGLVSIDTLHSAKGWEFRAVHIAACETLYRMGATQKRLIYTGILRGKTSAHLYVSGFMPGYLEAALAVLRPPPPRPSVEDLLP